MRSLTPATAVESVSIRRVPEASESNTPAATEPAPQQPATEVVGRLAPGAFHELANLAAAAMMTTHAGGLRLSGVDLAPEARVELDRLLGAVGAAHGRIRELLKELRQLGSLDDSAPVDIAAVVATTARLLRGQLHGLDLEFEVEPLPRLRLARGVVAALLVALVYAAAPVLHGAHSRSLTLRVTLVANELLVELDHAALGNAAAHARAHEAALGAGATLDALTATAGGAPWRARLPIAS